MLSFPKQFTACGPDMTELRFPSLATGTLLSYFLFHSWFLYPGYVLCSSATDIWHHSNAQDCILPWDTQSKSLVRLLPASVG